MTKFKPKKIPYEDFKFIYDRVPRLCFDLVFKNQDGILMSRRSIEPGKGLWHFPGGTLLKGETIHGAMGRVALEETGLEIGDCKLLGPMEFYKPENPFYHVVSFAYQVNSWSGQLRGSEQGEEIRFFREIPETMIEEQKNLIHEHQLL